MPNIKVKGYLISKYTELPFNTLQCVRNMRKNHLWNLYELLQAAIRLKAMLFNQLIADI